jgi:hypothetical protein
MNGGKSGFKMSRRRILNLPPFFIEKIDIKGINGK